MNPWLFAAMFMLVPSLILGGIVAIGTSQELVKRHIANAQRHAEAMRAGYEKRLESVTGDYARCACERNRLFALVYWAIGTTEMAISEITDDEDDTADAREKLREMKLAVGMDPDLDSMEQDSAVLSRIHNIQLRRPTS